VELGVPSIIGFSLDHYINRVFRKVALLVGKAALVCVAKLGSGQSSSHVEELLWGE